MRAASIVVIAGLLICFVSCVIAQENGYVPGTFWADFDAKYSEVIGKTEQRTLLARQTRAILGDASVMLDEGPSRYPVFQSPVGMTFNWLHGTMPRNGVAFNNKLRQTWVYNNQTFSVPDEVFIVFTPMVDASEEITVASSLQEFQSAHARRYGISVGFGPIALGMSREVGNARATFNAITQRITETEKRVTEYQVQLLPGNFVQLDPTIRGLLETLPRYDATTQQLYWKLFDDIGVGVITSATMGGEKYMKQVIETKSWGSQSKKWIEDNVYFVFQSLSEKDATRRKEWENKIDPMFKTSTTTETKRIGGADSLPFDRDDLWVPSIPSNPQPLRYALTFFYEWFPASQLREDLRNAAVDYLTSYVQPTLPGVFLGPEFQVGKDGNGASIAASSCAQDCHTKCCKRFLGFCRKKCETCTPRCGHTTLIRQGGGSHQFGKADGNQHAIVTLSQERYLTRITAGVSPVGQRGPTTMLQVFTSMDRSNWQLFGSVPSVTQQNHDFRKDYPVKARFILYKYGSANGFGSFVYDVNAFAVDQSRPLGFLESITENNVGGWAFDPLDINRPLAVKVSIKAPDGSVIEQSGQTGIARSDVTSRYNMPSGNPGFSVPYNLPVPASRQPTAYQVQVAWHGFQQQGSSVPKTMWWHRPPGRLLSVQPSYVEGWVYVPGNPGVVVTIWVDGQVAATGTANMPNSYVNTIYKVAGNFGFKIPLKIKGARVHQIKATVTLADGIPIELENTLQLDLRYPLGDVEVATPSRIAGWAIDPNNPDSPTEVHIYVDKTFFSKVTTSIVRSDINGLYVVDGAHGFDVTVRVQGGKIHIVDVYVMLQGKMLTAIVSRVVSLQIDDKGSQPVNNALVNNFLVGIDASNGEYRLRVGDLTYKRNKILKHEDWRETALYNLAIPDQMNINFNSEDIISNTTDVVNTTREYLEYKMTKSSWGISLGFLSFGRAKKTITIDQYFENKENRIGLYDREISIASVRSLPAPMMNFTAYARSLVDALPAYAPQSRGQYFKLFQLLGTDYLTSYTIGGTMSMETKFEKSFIHSASYREQQKQTSIGFSFFVSVSGSLAHSKAQQEIDQEFLKRSTWNFVREGGTPEYPLEEYDKWITTIKKQPAVVNYKTAPISDLCHYDSQKQSWLEQARLDYLRMQTPEHMLCAKVNVALPSETSKVIRYSSMARGQNENALVNILSDPGQRQPSMPTGETDFTFADGDPAQSLVVDLGFVRAIKTIAIDLTPYPAAHAIRDYVQVQASKDNNVWFDWGMAGDANGLPEITRPTYEFPSLVPMDIRYIKFNFGPGNPDGGRLSRIYAYLCEM